MAPGTRKCTGKGPYLRLTNPPPQRFIGNGANADVAKADGAEATKGTKRKATTTLEDVKRDAKKQYVSPMSYDISDVTEDLRQRAFEWITEQWLEHDGPVGIEGNEFEVDGSEPYFVSKRELGLALKYLKFRAILVETDEPNLYEWGEEDAMVGFLIEHMSDERLRMFCKTDLDDFGIAKDIKGEKGWDDDDDDDSTFEVVMKCYLDAMVKFQRGGAASYIFWQFPIKEHNFAYREALRLFQEGVEAGKYLAKKEKAVGDKVDEKADDVEVKVGQVWRHMVDKKTYKVKYSTWKKWRKDVDMRLVIVTRVTDEMVYFENVYTTNCDDKMEVSSWKKNMEFVQEKATFIIKSRGGIITMSGKRDLSDAEFHQSLIESPGQHLFEICMRGTGLNLRMKSWALEFSTLTEARSFVEKRKKFVENRVEVKVGQVWKMEGRYLVVVTSVDSNDVTFHYDQYRADPELVDVSCVRNMYWWHRNCKFVEQTGLQWQNDLRKAEEKAVVDLTNDDTVEKVKRDYTKCITFATAKQMIQKEKERLKKGGRPTVGIGEGYWVDKEDFLRDVLKHRWRYDELVDTETHVLEYWKSGFDKYGFATTPEKIDAVDYEDDEVRYIRFNPCILLTVMSNAQRLQFEQYYLSKRLLQERNMTLKADKEVLYREILKLRKENKEMQDDLEKLQKEKKVLEKQLQDKEEKNKEDDLVDVKSYTFDKHPMRGGTIVETKTEKARQLPNGNLELIVEEKDKNTGIVMDDGYMFVGKMQYAAGGVHFPSCDEDEEVEHGSDIVAESNTEMFDL